MNAYKKEAAPSLVQLELLDATGAQSDDAPAIRMSRRARRLSVRVYPDARVEVVVPPRARPGEVARFIAAQRRWIEEKRALALRERPALEPFPPPQIECALTGERWRVHLAGGAGRVRVRDAGGVLQVVGATGGIGLRRALRTWLAETARQRLEPRVAALARQAEVRYTRVAIRRQRSRWGSCSARGTISLNVCLLFQRPAVVDYLIVHELMHVRHMNHSARFWAAVERHCADWRPLDRELVQGWRHVPRWVFSDG